jgi:hypothetical protein
VRTVGDALALANEQLAVDVAVLRVELPGGRVVDGDRDGVRAWGALEILPPPNVDALERHARAP